MTIFGMRLLRDLFDAKFDQSEHSICIKWWFINQSELGMAPDVLTLITAALFYSRFIRDCIKKVRERKEAYLLLGKRTKEVFREVYRQVQGCNWQINQQQISGDQHFIFCCCPINRVVNFYFMRETNLLEWVLYKFSSIKTHKTDPFNFHSHKLLAKISCLSKEINAFFPLSEDMKSSKTSGFNAMVIFHCTCLILLEEWRMHFLYFIFS